MFTHVTHVFTPWCSLACTVVLYSSLTQLERKICVRFYGIRITMAKALASREGAAQMESPIISSASEKHTASLIFLHGSG